MIQDRMNVYQNAFNTWMEATQEPSSPPQVHTARTPKKWTNQAVQAEVPQAAQASVQRLQAMSAKIKGVKTELVEEMAQRHS